VKTFVNIRFPEKRLFLVSDKQRSSVENLHWNRFSLADVMPAILRTHSITYHVGYIIFLIDVVVKQHTSKDMQGYSSLCLRTVCDWSEALAVTATGDKRKEKEVAMAATKMENIRTGFIWSSARPATFTMVLNFERYYSGNTGLLISP
jgi:hypothetical protein